MDAVPPEMDWKWAPSLDPMLWGVPHRARDDPTPHVWENWRVPGESEAYYSHSLRCDGWVLGHSGGSRAVGCRPVEMAGVLLEMDFRKPSRAQQQLCLSVGGKIL